MRWRKRIYISLILIVTIFLLCAATWWILPDPLGYIPLQIRVRLPEQVINLLSTPVPTALPAARIPVSADRLDITLPTLEQPTITSTPRPSPTIQKFLPQTFTPQAEPIIEPTATLLPTETPSPTPTPRLPSRVELDGLEIIAQQFNNCGPANLTIVLNYYAQDLNQSEVGNALKPGYDDRNVSPGEMATFVRENTPLLAEAYSGGDLAVVKRLLAGGFPVILEKGYLPSSDLGWMGHYLTVYGYDDLEASFLAMDTYLGPWDSSGRLESYTKTIELWEHFNNTFIVVYGPDDTSLVHELIGDPFLSADAMWINAAAKSQERTEEEPDNAFAWFNLGTSLTRLGEITGESHYHENAARAFDRARSIGLPWRMLWYQFDPYPAYLAVDRADEVLLLTLSAQDVEETHFYRGQALLSTGDERGAEAAFRRALQINPNYQAAREALQMLTE